MTPAEIIAAVDRGAALEAEIKTRSDELKEIKRELARLPAGDYVGDSGKIAKVIQPKPAIKPAPDKIDIIREHIGDDNFKLLFVRIADWKPVKEIRAIAERILTKSQLRQFLGLSEVQSQPYVIFQ